MAAPGMGHHYKHPYGYGSNNSDAAWQWWHNEADHE
jgi:hypothetical protein